MANISLLCQRLVSSTVKSPVYGVTSVTCDLFLQQVRSYNIYKVFQPNPGDGKNYRFKVHYPEDGEYTVKPLKMTKLAGRDPETGRIINGALGGGAKRKYRWIDWVRTGPSDGTFYEEKILNILYDPNRTSKIALVGSGDTLRYRIATDNMQKGDMIRTSTYIPRIPVRPKDGDAYPLGALPMATSVCLVELLPGDGAKIVKAAGTSAIVKRKVDDKVIIQLPSKREMALDARCMVTVGRVSNPDHGKQHIGSAQRNRWLGNRPKSGLWQRKTGYHGRKIKPLPPVKSYDGKKKTIPYVVFQCNGEGPPRPITPSTNRVT